MNAYGKIEKSLTPFEVTDILKEDKMIKNILYYTFVFFIIACNNNDKTKKVIKEEKYSSIPFEEYEMKEFNIDFFRNYDENLYVELYSKIRDSIAKRNKKKLEEFLYISQYPDSIICINQTKDKIIFFESYLNPTGEELDAGFVYWYGKKINKQWYFFSGAYQPIEKPKNGHNTKESVHKWIKKASQSYLKRDKNGNLHINERIFKDFDDLKAEVKRASYPRNKLEQDRIYVVNSMREFYEDKMLHEVYKPKDFSFKYDKSKEEFTITCPIKKWNEFPVDYQLSWYYDEYQPTEKDIRFVPMSQKESSCTIKNVKANDDVYFIFSFAGREGIDGVGLIYYHYKLVNGKARFIGLVPDEADILDFPKTEQDSVRKAWQKRIDERLGKNYGK